MSNPAQLDVYTNVIIPAVSGLLGALIGAVATYVATHKQVKTQIELQERAAQREADTELRTLIEEIETPLLDAYHVLISEPRSPSAGLSFIQANHLIFKACNRTDDQELIRKLMYLTAAIGWVIPRVGHVSGSDGRSKLFWDVQGAYGDLKAYVFGEPGYDVATFVTAGVAGKDLPGIDELKRKQD